MKACNNRIDFRDNLKGQCLTVSLRGSLCGVVSNLLVDHELLDALDIIFDKSPDDYVGLKLNDYSLIFGRLDEIGTLPDW